VTSNGAKFDVANGRDITVNQSLLNAAGQTGTLTKLGIGALTISGDHTYAGATTVSAGTLLVNGSLAGGAVSVAAGATFGGTATVGGAVTTVSGARILPGSSANAGTLSVGALTLVSGVAVEFDLGATRDVINVANPGGLVLNGGVFSLFNTGTLTPFSTNGDYPLIDYAGTFTGSTANINIGNALAGKFYSINNDTTNTVITLTIGDATLTEWNAGTGPWTTAANWTAGVPNAAGAVAKFGTIPISPTTVTVNGAKTVGGIVFENANAYTISGGAADTITLSNGIAAAGINVNAGNHLITAPIILETDTLASTSAGTTLQISGNVSGAKAFTAAGSGVTILTGTNTYDATVVSSGILQIGDNGTNGTLGSGVVTISNGAFLVFNRSDSLTVANNISGNSGQVTKFGVGTLTLTGVNTFGTFAGGGLNLNAGVVKVGNATALPSGILLNFTGGTLDLNENNIVAGSISGSTGTITDSSATAGETTVTIDAAIPSTYGGVIANGSTRNVAVVKSGPSTLTLSGNNTYKGPITIKNGALMVAGPLGSTPIPGNITIGDGTNVVYLTGAAPENPNQFAASTVLTFNNGTLNAKFQLRGSNLTVEGLEAGPATTLSIVQNDDTLAPGYTVPPPLATLTINSTTNHSFTGLLRNQNGGGLNIVKTGVGTQEVRNIGAQGHNFNVATIDQGKLVFNINTIAGGVANHNVLGANVSITVNTGGILGLDGTWNMNRTVSGDGSVFKQGTGNVTISNANFYTGPTTVSEGILTAASPSGLALPGNVIMGTGVQSGIFLVMGAENQFGATSVIKFDNGTARDAKVELRGFSQTIEGLESDADDTLSIVQNQETGTPVAATLTINATTDHIFHGIIRTQSTGGTLSLVKNGPGTQELRNVAAVGYSFDSATINAGKLTFNFSGATATMGATTAFTVATGAALGLDGDWDFNRPVAGSGDVVKQGTGVVSISSFLTHTGNTIVAGGTLALTGGLSGTARVDVQSGGTLSGTGSLILAAAPTGNINLLAGGKLAPGPATGFTPGTLITSFSGGGALDLSLAVTPANSQSLLFDLDSIFGSDAVSLTGGALKIGVDVLAFNDFVFNPLGGFGLGTYTLFDGDTAIVGSLDPVAANLTGSIGAFAGTLAFADGGKDLVLLVTIPEPGSAACLLAGLVGLLSRRRRVPLAP
jgi:fibronectin-binding autotransporter adhesin